MLRILVLALFLASSAGAAPWAPIGPEGGVIRRLLIDPSAPSTLYLSTDQSFYKSVDGAATWTRHNTGIPPGTFPYRLALDPTTPTTLYAGLFTVGVAKSTDAGVTWSVLPGSPPFVRSLGVDGAGRIYVGTFSGVSRSTDGGATWLDTTLGGEIEALAVDPVTAGTVWVATFNFGPGSDNVYRSTDGGVTFTPTTLGDKDTTALAVDPVSPSTVYATGGRTFGPPVAPAYKTTDAGATWSALSGLPGFLNVSESPIGIDPVSPSTIYLGGLLGPYKSTNGGGSFTLLATGIENPRVDAFALHPTTSGRLWVGTFSGVYESTDGAASWAARNSGIREFDLNGILVDPTDATILYAADQNAGFFRSSDGGNHWSPIDVGLTTNEHEVDQLIAAPGGTTTLYARVNFSSELVRSLDAGASWMATGLDIPLDAGPLALATDPNAPSTLYVGVDASSVGGIPGVYVSTDSGASFAPTGGPADESVTAIAVAPSSGRIYAAAGPPVFRSDDAGATFPYVGSVPGGTNALAVDPLDADVALAGSDGGVYRSEDGGATWTYGNGSSGAIHAVALDPLVPGRALAAGDAGVFVSLDGGVTWATVNAGLPTLTVAAAAFDPVTAGRIYAGPLGGSAWRRDLAPCTADADCIDPDLCTTDACLPSDSAADAFGCVHTALVCPPATECKIAPGVCNPTTGACQYTNRPDGTACTEDGSGCTSDRCENGVCEHAAELVLSCRTPGQALASQIVYKQPSADKAKLIWTWKKGDVALSDLGDPLTAGATDWELCLFDHGGPGGDVRFLTGIRAPAGGTCAGKPCWTPKGVAFKYRDKDRTPDGMDALLLKSGVPGAGSLKVVAKGVNLSLPATALVPGVTVQLRRDDDPLTCWQGIFTSGIKTNVPGSFKAKSQ